MSWVSRRRFCSYLALAGLALQLILSFGHVHLDHLSGGSGVVTVTTANVPGRRRLRRSIRPMTPTTIARFARPSTSLRRRSCRTRRNCRCRSSHRRSSISSHRVHFHRATANSFSIARSAARSDPRSLLILRLAALTCRRCEEMKRGNSLLSDPRAARPVGRPAVWPSLFSTLWRSVMSTRVSRMRRGYLLGGCAIIVLLGFGGAATAQQNKLPEVVVTAPKEKPKPRRAQVRPAPAPTPTARQRRLRRRRSSTPRPTRSIRRAATSSPPSARRRPL